jgi:glycosyltransferase involved in cell wall biosynthesis
LFGKLKNNIRKYWFVSQYYWPIENSTGHIITRIIDVFTRENKAHIITVGNTKSEERNRNTYTIRINDHASLNKNKLFQRLLKLTIISIKMSVSVLRNIRRGDVVVAVTNPAFILIFFAFIKLFINFKLIILVHDVFPENLVVCQIIADGSLLYKISKKIFNFAYNKADVLITCGRDMQRTIIKKVEHKNKVVFIPNFGDTDILYPISKEHNPILQKLHITKKLVVFFTGNIGRMQNIDNLIKTAELLKDDPYIAFLFIGEGVYQDKIKAYSEKNGNLFFIPNMSRDDSLIFLNAGDIGLSTLLPNMMGVGVPCKTYSYMATGKPIIAVMDDDSEIAEMVQEEGNGWVVEANNPNQLAMFLKQLKKTPNIINEKGRKSLELSQTKYSIENITNQYIQTIINV